MLVVVAPQILQRTLASCFAFPFHAAAESLHCLLGRKRSNPSSTTCGWVSHHPMPLQFLNFLIWFRTRSRWIVPFDRVCFMLNSTWKDRPISANMKVSLQWEILFISYFSHAFHPNCNQRLSFKFFGLCQITDKLASAAYKLDLLAPSSLASKACSAQLDAGTRCIWRSWWIEATSCCISGRSCPCPAAGSPAWGRSGRPCCGSNTRVLSPKNHLSAGV